MTNDNQQIEKLKRVACWRTARLMVRVLWKDVLLSAVIFTFILHSLAPNTLVLFAGCLTAIIAWHGLLPKTRNLWLSNYVTVCQQNGLWELSEKLLKERGGTALEQILDGRIPTTQRPANFDLVLSQFNLLLIRKGELRKSGFLTQQLFENSSASSKEYHKNSLIALNIELGKFDKAAELLEGGLDGLKAAGRENSPAYTFKLLAKVELNLCLHKIGAVEEALSLIKVANQNHKRPSKDRVDNLVKSQAEKGHLVDEAVYLNSLGRLCILKGDFADALIALAAGREIMSDRKLQQRSMLRYPEFLTAEAEAHYWLGQYAEAESKLLEAIEYYNVRTIYRGVRFALCKSWLQHCKLKQNISYEHDVFENTVSHLETELGSKHPLLGEALWLSAASYLQQGETAKARGELERVLNIWQPLYPDNDQRVVEVRARLSRLEQLIAPTLSSSAT